MENGVGRISGRLLLDVELEAFSVWIVEEENVFSFLIGGAV